MKRKGVGPSAPIVSREFLERARQAAETDKAKKLGKCMVCGAECPASPAEQLCWVCRRLKISAWREAEQQMPAQE